MSPSTRHPGAVLREALQSPPVPVPGAYDVLSALMVEQAGFPAVLLGSYCMTAAQLGLPDLGIVSSSEMAEAVRRVCDRVTIPVVADVDTGYNGGGMVNLRRTVEEFERAGAACIQLEDQTSPKKAGLTAGRTLVAADEMARKVEMVVRSRSETDFLLMARTDAQDIDEAVARIQRYVDAGADLVMIEDFRDLDELRTAADAVSVPVVYAYVEGGPAPRPPLDELGKAGAGLVYYPISTLGVTVAAVGAVLGELATTGSTRATEETGGAMVDFTEIGRLVGDPEWRSL